MAEQAGGGTGELVLNPAVGRPGNPGLRSVRRPGGSARNRPDGRRRGSARGRYPPARSWLTETARQLRFGGRVSPEGRNGRRIRKSRAGPESAARRRKEERRSRAP